MKHLLPYLDRLEPQASEMLQLVIDLCNINSGTFHLAGLDRVRERLIQAFSSLDGEIETIPADPYTMIDDEGNQIQQILGKIIHIRKWPEAERRVLLCIHMDTVYGKHHPFQECQMLENGNLLGPGVADAKGGLVVMLHALQTLEASPLAGTIGWDVLINADEEIGAPGSLALIHRLAPTCDFGLLFEPALPDGTLVSWRKGCGNFVFVVRGRSAHSGREFEKGRNAIVALARLLVRVADLNTNPEVTYNVGRVRGGAALNIVPNLAIGRVNVRVKTPAQQQEVQENFERLVADANTEEGIQVEVSGQFLSPPKPVTPQSEAIQKRIEASAQALGIPVQWRGTGGACDGNKMAAAGLPNIDTLGPCGGCIHSTDEYLIPESLVPRTKLTALVLLAYADSVKREHLERSSNR